MRRIKMPRPASAATSPARRRSLALLLGGAFMLHLRSFAATLSVARASGLVLDAPEHSVPLTVDAAHGPTLLRIAQGQAGALSGDDTRYRYAFLVLDDVRLTAAGAAGGYFYSLYLLARADLQPAAQRMIATLGPFEIAAARQRGDASLRYSLAGPLAALSAQNLFSLRVFFRRAGGAGTPDGPLIRIGGIRLKLSTADLN